MLRISTATVTLLLCSIPTVDAFNSFFAPPATKSAQVVTPPPSNIEIDSWLDDKLKYDTPPTFDVLQRTIEFAQCTTYAEVEKYYDEEYVFRGGIVGPITAKDVKETQKGFNILDAYPDLQTRPFGFTIDPDNEYRCFYFERWEGTNTAGVKIGPGEPKEPTNRAIKLPTHIMSLNWNPEGKVQYACLSAPLDRFEGNVGGVGAVFGLLKGAGVNISGASVGNPVFRAVQRLGHAIGGLGRNWSVEEEIPSWWKSKSRGADPTDM
jgi:hypothetical protein